MARLTERVRFTVPADVKAEWKASAAARGISLSAFLRNVTEDLLIKHQVEVADANSKRQASGAEVR